MAEGWLWLSMRRATAMPAAGVDDPGVLPRADQHMGPFGRQAAQMDPARLVGAVLAPHDRVHGQLEMVGRAAEQPLDGGGLVVGQPEGPVQRHLDGVGHGVDPPRCHRRRRPRPGGRAGAEQGSQEHGAVRRSRGAGRWPARGGASGRRRCPPRCAMPAMSPIDRWDCPCSAAPPGPRLRSSARVALVAGVVALEVVDRDAQAACPRRTPPVSTDRSLATSSSTVSHRNVRPRFFCSAPGSRWASVGPGSRCRSRRPGRRRRRRPRRRP